MRVWLLSWNPKNWDLSVLLNKPKSKDGIVVERWMCRSKQPKIGDRVFLVRVGDEYSGIVAAGHVFKESYTAPHYENESEEAGSESNYIDVAFDHLQDDTEDALRFEQLNSVFPNQTWRPQSSGIEIQSENVDFTLLEKMWGDKIGLQKNFKNYVKTLKDINPYEHDGSYEFVKKIVERYRDEGNLENLDSRDLDVLYLSTVHTNKNSIEKKKERIIDSNLSEASKEQLIILLDDLWSRADAFGNSENVGYKIFGMFGTGQQRTKATPESAQQFIKLCVNLLPINDSLTAFQMVEEVLKDGISGIRSAVGSQILHCLKPSIFPIINGGNKNESDIYKPLGLNLKDRDLAENYVANARLIERFRNENVDFKNYRVLDLASSVLNPQIDYKTILKYIEEYRGLSYENPNNRDLTSARKDELLRIKSAGQFATDELKKVGTIATEKFSLVKSSSPVKYLDGSNVKTRNYLWLRLIADQTTRNEALSISIFVEMSEVTNRSRFRVTLEVENDKVTANKQLLEQHHKFLEIEPNPTDNLVYVSGSNEFSTPVLLNESRMEIKRKVNSGEYNKVQLCRIIDHEANLGNEEYEKNILEGIAKLMPFYNHVLERETEEWYPSKEIYDPGLTKEDFIKFLKDGIALKEEKDLLLTMMKLGGIAHNKALVEAGLEDRSYLRATDLSQRICKNYNIKEHGEKNAKYWPVAFLGRKSPNDPNEYYEYKIREELQEAIKEVFMKELTTIEAKISENMILFGPPGTGKTYHTVIYAVAICQNLSIEAVKAKPYDEVKKDFDHLMENEGRIKFVTFHQSYDYEEFIEGIKPDFESGELRYILEPGIFRKFAEDAEKNHSQKYVFIIDEINRGNIAKIFGELITLIEDNKRTGEGQIESMRIRLPYSKIEFGVPKNLHIIGTMNTADRSIALLDTALRRRFNFVEMLPDKKVLEENHADYAVDSKNNKVNVAAILEKINSRIISLYDREHTIGHAFFMPLKENNSLDTLANIFRTKIIPLLQEYFHEDYEKIRLVLGDNRKTERIQFIKRIRVDRSKEFGGSIDFDIPDYRYEISIEAFNNIESYQGIIS